MANTSPKAWSSAKAVKWGAVCGVVWMFIHPMLEDDPLPTAIDMLIAQGVGSAIGGGFLGLLVAWARNKLVGAKEEPTIPPTRTAPEPETFAPLPPPEPLSPEEQVIADASRIAKDAADERTREYRAKQDSLQDAKKLVERADKFAKESRLDHAIPYTFEAIQHFPSWSKREDGSRWVPEIGMSDFEGNGSLTREGWVQWRYADYLFRLDFKKWDSHFDHEDTNEHGDMRLTVDGVESFKCMVSRDWTKDYSVWRYSVIDTFKIGNWVTAFIEEYTKLRAFKERKQEERDADYHLSKAGRIDLGDSPTN